MIPVSEIKTGGVVSFDKEMHKVLESVTHAGGGKAGSMVHLKLRNLSNGHISEKRLNTDDKVEEIPVERVKMQMLYREGESFCFMNSKTFDQLTIPKNVVGPAGIFLKENDECEVEFFEEKALSVRYQPTVEMKVASAGAGLQGQNKEATLENGLTVLVPHFVEEGDSIHVDVETGKYLDRVSDREVKGAKFTVSAPPQKVEPKVEPKADAKKDESKPKDKPR